jgi:hypothetical protein
MPKNTVEAVKHANTNGQPTAVPARIRQEVSEQSTVEREEDIGCWDGIPQST